MRLALNFRREIADPSPPATAAAGTRSSARSRCAQVVEKAFGLPSQFSQIDIDQQRDTLRKTARPLFGIGRR